MTSLICKVGWNSRLVRSSRGVGKHHEIVSDRPRSTPPVPSFVGEPGPRDHSFHAIHPAENNSHKKGKVSFK